MIDKAITFATLAHEGQFRKGTQLPYIVHPLEVGVIVSRMTQDKEVIAAAKLAHCDEFAEKLSDGWNTVIGENGSELSGGERQRISIARAFLKDAQISLLDEATASLDVYNETIIQEALSHMEGDLLL